MAKTLLWRVREHFETLANLGGSFSTRLSLYRKVAQRSRQAYFQSGEGHLRRSEDYSLPTPLQSSLVIKTRERQLYGVLAQDEGPLNR
jgi:hypothetical protein